MCFGEANFPANKYSLRMQAIAAIIEPIHIAMWAYSLDE